MKKMLLYSLGCFSAAILLSCRKIVLDIPYSITTNVGFTGNIPLPSNSNTMLCLIYDGTGVQGTDTTGFFYVLYDYGVNDVGFSFYLNLHDDSVIVAPNGESFEIKFNSWTWEWQSEPDYSTNPPSIYTYWQPTSANLSIKSL